MWIPKCNYHLRAGHRLSVCHRVFWPGCQLFWRHWCFHWAQVILARQRRGRTSQAVRICWRWQRVQLRRQVEKSVNESKNERAMWWRKREGRPEQAVRAEPQEPCWDLEVLLRNKRSCWGVLSRRVTNADLLLKKILLAQCSLRREQEAESWSTGAFFFNRNFFFFFLILVMLGLHCYAGAFSSCGKWGHYSSLWWSGFSVWWLLLLRGTSSGHEGLAVPVHGPRCPTACGVLWCPLHWQTDS